MDWKKASNGERFEEAERRIEAARQEGAKSLDLGDLGLHELPASLGRLEELEELFLGQICRRRDGEIDWAWIRPASTIISLAPVPVLRKLRALYIGPCPALAGDLAPFAQLLNLQSLSISNCNALAGDLAPLAQLLNLQSLQIYFCYHLDGDLTPLAQLLNLQSLEIFFCPALAGGLAPLANLLNLQSLEISVCPALAGGLAPLAHLLNLQSLKISFCDALAGDFAPLAHLLNLQSLEISFCNALTGDLTALQGLTKLESLKAYHTSGLRFPLEFSRQLVRKVPPLNKLVCDVIEGIPSEVLSEESYYNCLPRLRSYLAELDAGVAEEADVKLILLGNGRVGKTQLCRRLRNKEFEPNSVSTHGVQLYRQPLQLRKDGTEMTYFANWWDFGGQDIYHSTHSLFLRSRAVFLILWTPRLENCDEFEENGIPLRNQPLAYWLDYVRSLAGSDSPVIVVQSKCESFSAEREAPPARATGFQFAKYCSFGAANNHGRETLEALLHDALRYLGEKNGRLVIGTGRAKLRERLYELRNTERTLDFTAFEALCQEVGDIAFPEHALDYFHQTGVLFHQKGIFGDRTVLDQSWALDAVYTVFHRASTMPALRERGTFTRQDLEGLCWQDTPRKEQRIFLGLMESCGICFVHQRAADDEHTYLAPDLLPTYKKIKKQLFAWNPDAEEAVLRLEYRFLHQALLRSLISRIGTDARDNAIYWKYGLWLRTAGGTQLLIRQEALPTGDAPGAGCLRIAAQGPEWARLIDQVRREIRESPVLEKPEESLMLGGVTVARRDLDHWVDGKVRTVDGRTADPRPFAEFWNEERLERWEAFAMPPTPTFAAAPLPPAPAEPEVYISYAWGDDTPEGQVRTEVVNRLCDALRGDGFVVHRDCDDIAPGDLISKFIRDLVHAKFVVAIISDKYLRSPYCMFELYKLYQACRGENEALAAKVVPVVLPGTKLTTLTERAKYIRHWKKEHATAEKLAKELGLSFGDAAYRDARLIQEFAHFASNLIAFIGDVLMGRKLAVHYSNDFENVRQALKRKIGPLA